MRAILCNAWGDPESLELGEAPEPRLANDGVLIAPAAWGVNFADLVLIRGLYHVKPPFPFIPGMEVAGEVMAVGSGEVRFKPGDHVAAYVETGGYAERVAAKAAATMLLPAGMTFETGAAFTVTYGTAYVALRHRARLRAGETLLVLGAAGGVGLAAVELGQHLGATVIAAASQDAKLSVAREHGAHHLINYQSVDLRDRVLALTNGRGVDAVFDPVGGDAFDAALRCVAFEGRVIVIGFAGGRIPTASAGRILIKGCSVIGSNWTFTLERRPDVVAAGYEEMSSWYAAGALRPRVSRLLPFDRAAEALRLLADRKAIGKIVLN
jgi:NADPH2:quinone reductase